MGLRNAWRRYLAWRRAKIARYSTGPRWEADNEPFVGWFSAPEPKLSEGEYRVLASFGTVQRGWTAFGFSFGSLWLTNRRLVYRSQKLTVLPFTPRHIEIDRSEIAAVRKRSRLRAFFLASSPFMGAFEVKTQKGKTHLFQTMKPEVWVEELSSKTDAKP